MCENCGVSKVRKTEYLEDILKFLSGDFEQEIQYILFKTFDEIPISQVRRACLEKIIPGKENFPWLLETVKNYLEINDHITVLLLLEKFSQFEEDSQEDAFRVIVAAINLWLAEDDRFALKAGLNIVYKKLEKNPDLYLMGVRSIFQAILEKYDNNEIKRTENDFKMLSDLIAFIYRIDRDYFIPILEKNVKTWKEFQEMQKPNIDSCGKSISQIMFEMERGIITGQYKDIIEAKNKAENQKVNS